MADLRDPVELTDRQYREVVAYCSGVVDVDAVTDGEWCSDPSSVMAVLLRHLRNMLVDPVGAQSLKHVARVVRDEVGVSKVVKDLHAGDQVQVHLPVELGGGSARGTVARQSDGNSETLVVILEGTYG